jgi:DNA-binding NtrC family response regulator
MCLNERVKFPSIPKRSSSLINIISDYLLFKGLELPGFCSDSWISRQSFHNGFIDIFTFMQDHFLPQPSFFNMMENGNNLRGVIKKIEMLAIEYAIKIVGKSQNKIAKFLGISRGSLQHKLKKYGYSNKEWEE